MRRINTRAELVALAAELGVSSEWHEPDNQGVTAAFAGTERRFDNAGFWGGHSFGSGQQEMYVVLHRQSEETDNLGTPLLGEAIAAVNLATLFAWATGLDDDSRLRVDWKAEVGKIDDQLTDILHRAGIDYPTGLPGVRDLVAQRDGHLQHVRELEDRLADVARLAGRLGRNPDVSRDVVAELWRVLGEEHTPTRRLAEAEYRSRISAEVHRYGEELDGLIGGTIGTAVRAIVDRVGDQVGKIGGGVTP